MSGKSKGAAAVFQSDTGNEIVLFIFTVLPMSLTCVYQKLPEYSKCSI